MSSPVVFMFTSPTCVPCQTIKPTIAELRHRYSNFVWVDVNTQNDRENLADKWKVTHVPTMVVARGDEIVGRHTGGNAVGYLQILKKAGPPASTDDE